VIQSLIQPWLTANGFGEIVATQALGGGCINNVTRLTFDGGASLILKHQSQPPDGLFQAEAAGLSALAASDSLRVASSIAAHSDFLLLEDLGQGSPKQNFWQQFGAGLAAIHSKRESHFGFTVNTYCGSTVQDNSRTENGFDFFSHQRLLPVARSCHASGLLSAQDMKRLDRVCEQLPRWIPEQPPVLIHGDLWTGNMHCDGEGQPALIDPAACWGWAEAELAMTTLFGRCPEEFYASYLENSHLDPHWEERAFIYNLYHLLNHLKLFGRSYLSAVRRTLARLGP